ncbi:hypothetical protein QBC46DRAFT_382322 [Diplogelasinospora grovesii]|uniref:Uncharacterized protein n=1 Tax=Diplogelasinospora grovesii TaxID=303347 RepID=A0AAN6S544_9PEZI|nr:hypothetical protein QBC46DRAFT_382322 [Diplogelasinospora grovesii]
MAAPEVSHGRGGAGNINPDDTPYTDGEVVRAGAEGSHGDGAFSTGRGGTGNIGDAHKPQAAKRLDKEIIPETATRPSQDNSDYHTGRGGAGNEHLAPGHDHKKAERHTPKGLADKLKSKLFGAFGGKK